MTDKEQYWDRLAQIIRWFDTTPNRFAMQVGMARAENLYHIKNGVSGISPEFANRVVSHFPEINRTWLLTGVGNMLVAEVNRGVNIPFYDGEITEILPIIATIAPTDRVTLPFAKRCDFIACSSVGSGGNSAMQLFFRYVDILRMGINSDYALLTYSSVLYGKVLNVDDENISFVNYIDNTKITINLTDIKQAWLVIAKFELQGSY